MRLLAAVLAVVLAAAPAGVAVGVTLATSIGVGVAVASGLYGVLAAAFLLTDNLPTPPPREASR